MLYYLKNMGSGWFTLICVYVWGQQNKPQVFMKESEIIMEAHFVYLTTALG